MPTALPHSEWLARAWQEVEVARQAKCDTTARPAARTNRIRSALRRAAREKA